MRILHQLAQYADSGSGAWLGLSFLAIVLLALAVGLAVFIFWLLMLIDAIKWPYPDEKDKTMWIILHLAAFFFGLHLVSALVYYFVVKKKFANQAISSAQTTNSSEPTDTWSQ